MAGHSKWANIRFKKAAADSKRGKLFTKLIREITVAAKMGGADEDANPRLRDAVRKGLAGNMKRDTIEKAIQRGVGGGDGTEMQTMRYEGYGPSGVAILVDCLSDNKNRTVGEVRHALTKYGGNLGTDGSVAYLFTKQGQLSFPQEISEDQLLEVALEAGAEDIQGNLVITSPEEFYSIKSILESSDLEPEYAEIVFEASTKVMLDTDSAETLGKLLDALEDCDDVQHVYTNAEIAE